jgi:hypothetical protein
VTLVSLSFANQHCDISSSLYDPSHSPFT